MGMYVAHNKDINKAVKIITNLLKDIPEDDTMLARVQVDHSEGLIPDIEIIEIIINTHIYMHKIIDYLKYESPSRK